MFVHIYSNLSQVIYACRSAYLSDISYFGICSGNKFSNRSAWSKDCFQAMLKYIWTSTIAKA